MKRSASNPSRRLRRSGLRVRTQRAYRETKQPILRFAKWLRTEYEFPIRVFVQLLPGENFRTLYGDVVVASFRYPASRKDKPLIRLATGDYPFLKAKWGRDDALSSILLSLCWQVARYRRWVATGSDSDKGVGTDARKIIRGYKRQVKRP